jgi:hypothetical protein
MASRFGIATPARGTLGFAIQQSGGNLEQARATYEAQQAGFSSVLEQQLNRTLRNQLEQTALSKGYKDLNQIYSQAQSAVGGGELTSNATLQKMYEYVAGLDPFEEEPVVEEPKPVVEEVSDADKITEEGEDILSEADKFKLYLDDFEKRQAAAAEQAEKLRIQSQKTFAANMERSQMTPNLQIMPASTPSQMAGTQGFKARKRGGLLGAAGSVLSGLNLGQTNTMNV